MKEEQNIACFDFIGELVKSNKRCMAMFEIQLGEHNLNRILALASSNVIDSNLFFRSIMISIIYFYDQTQDLQFISDSILCSYVLDQTVMIVTKLMNEI